MVRIVRYLGYVVLALGIAAYLAGMGGAFLRGGIWAVSEMLTSFKNVLFLGVCVGPGLVILGWANDRSN